MQHIVTMQFSPWFAEVFIIKICICLLTCLTVCLTVCHARQLSLSYQAMLLTGFVISFSVKPVVSILATNSKRSLRSKPCFARSTFQIIIHFQMHPTHLISSQGEGHQTNLTLSSDLLICNKVRNTDQDRSQKFPLLVSSKSRCHAEF